MLNRAVRRSLVSFSRSMTARTGSSSSRVNGLLRSVARQSPASFLAVRKLSSLSASQPMMCYQCEQTRDGVGCFTEGVCGKSADTANMQDVLLYELIALGTACKHAKSVPDEVNFALTEALFSTLTNVNFSSESILGYIKHIQSLRLKLEHNFKPTPFAVFGEGEHPINFRLPQHPTIGNVLAMDGAFGVRHRLDAAGQTLGGLHEFIWYCIKGLGAYTTHAHATGHTDANVYKFFHEALAFLGSPECMDLNNTLSMIMKIGEVNITVLGLLDKGHNVKFGQPSPTSVKTSAVPGKCILISGHDLVDLEQLLEQTEGKGINIYTHGEMLPAHGYPKLRQYKHLVGNYGTAWQMQKTEFAQFPGAILMTSNCIVEPRKSYRERIFTTAMVGYDGIKHIPGEPGKKDFSAVIEAALAAPGFTDAQTETSTTTGFGHGALLGMADTIVKAIQEKKISHFFVVGGCDGSETERNYFRDVVLNTPQDSVILTAGCGKYRFNKLNTGNIPELGIPRVLDMGQCNDLYGAVVVALKLAEVFKTDVNGLPLSLCISWFEQKAAVCLATVLFLNFKNIVLGPNLPAFLSPEALALLSEKFGIRKADCENPMADIKRFMGTQ